MNWFESAKEHLAKWKAQEKVFTPRALQVFGIARHEADRLKHNYVGTEHLLLGLIKLGNGVATNVIISLGLNLEAVRLEIENRAGFGSEKIVGNIPFTPRMKRVLETAKKEAVAIGHGYIGTEHLLLGLLNEQEGLAAEIFKHFNLDTEKMRKEILKEITPIFPGDDAPGKQG
jgi:ATP-dependent Clp protease ATP-binding subunit ClpC